MSRICQFTEVRADGCYCLGTREIDPCPCDGDPYLSRCYYPKKLGEKEIHFYSSTDYTVDSTCLYLVDWENTLSAINAEDTVIHTLQMGLLTISSKLFDAGYRIFIHDDHGEFELTLGDCARTNREIRYAHNHFKMWVSGEFTNYDKR
jgi:hypothetical protein